MKSIVDVTFCSKPLSGCHLIWMGITHGTFPAKYQGHFDDEMCEYKINDAFLLNFPQAKIRNSILAFKDAHAICGTPNEFPDWIRVDYDKGQNDSISYMTYCDKIFTGDLE